MWDKLSKLMQCQLHNRMILPARSCATPALLHRLAHICRGGIATGTRFSVVAASTQFHFLRSLKAVLRRFPKCHLDSRRGMPHITAGVTRKSNVYISIANWR
jgi:hypothetical protein